jgi:glycine amidinotransferase
MSATRTMSEYPVVNAFNEWDPLEEVIVGVSDGSNEPSFNVDPVWKYLFHSEEKSLSKPGPYPKALIETAKRELDNLTRVLENEHVIVRRPTPMNFSSAFSTPAFSVPNGFNATCPRDVLMVVGNEIIEAPMALRSRYFEYQCYRPLIHEYFRQGAEWTAAPKGIQDDSLYDVAYPEDKSSPERAAALAERRYVTTETEPIWDAADFMRFGKDIFGQRSFVTNEFGIEWVRRHLKPKGFRVHSLFSEDKVPKHIDCTLVPLRPGLVLENPTRKMYERQTFLDNGWTIQQCVNPEGSTQDEFSDSVIRPTSVWIGMNVLSIDDRTIVASEKEKDIHRMLESLGFRVLQVPFKAMYYLGGGFHCATTDVRRRGTMQSYFPKYDELDRKQEEAKKYTRYIGQ